MEPPILDQLTTQVNLTLFKKNQPFNLRLTCASSHIILSSLIPFKKTAFIVSLSTVIVHLTIADLDDSAPVWVGTAPSSLAYSVQARKFSLSFPQSFINQYSLVVLISSFPLFLSEQINLHIS